MIVIVCAVNKKNPSRTVDASEWTRFSKSRPNDLEDIDQGQGSSHATHPLMLLIICTKYGKNPSWTVDATGWTRKVNEQTDRQTDRVNPIYTPPPPPPPHMPWVKPVQYLSQIYVWGNWIINVFKIPVSTPLTTLILSHEARHGALLWAGRRFHGVLYCADSERKERECILLNAFHVFSLWNSGKGWGCKMKPASAWLVALGYTCQQRAGQVTDGNICYGAKLCNS